MSHAFLPQEIRYDRATRDQRRAASALWARYERWDQGLPEKVTDPAVYDRLAVLSAVEDAGQVDRNATTS